ncbi:MAG: NADPH:quinone reductase [Nitrospinota bacterium]|nr:NADPH:quinone reductase [Nitrospinota bacterium]
MRAIWYEKYGPAKDVLIYGELDTPEAGSGEVRIRLHASGANPSDYKARLGSRGKMRWSKIIPHSDGAGVVDEVGSGVTTFREGDRVWVFNAQWKRPMGTACEFVVLPERQVVPLPENVSFEEGACLAIPAMTAHLGLFLGRPLKDKVILVTGGAGAVGNYGIQLAKWAGAKVIATVSTDEKATIAMKVGADSVVNYKNNDKITEQILDLTSGEGVDQILDVDFGENLPVTKQVLKENGIIAAYGSTRVPEPVFAWYDMMQKNFTIRMIFMYSVPDADAFKACEDIVNACNEYPLIHQIASVFSLEDTASSHEVMEKFENTGNVVVKI